MKRARGLSLPVLLAATVALTISGCTSSATNADGQINLTVATFGDFGYEPLIAQYERDHPNIHIENKVADFDTHNKQLVTELASGHGAADVEAIDEQYIPQFRQSADKFVNLADYGALNLKSQWVDWKWQQGVLDGGKQVLGLGTDMGGLAMCYRPELFAKAGLPTDRDQVAALWPTWEQFANVADRFTKANPGAKFADSAGTIYTAILNQAPENYFSQKDDSFIADRNPALRRAFDIAASIGAKGQTAQVTTYTQEWNVAIKQGTFATIACPAWLLQQIREAGGDANAGKWDITAVPGNSGNNGGSFLTVPKQSSHPKEAYELAAWLTAPQQQKQLFLSAGILPSEPAAYHDPQVLGKTDAYFHDAPIGQIFARSADNLTPNYRGTRDADVRPEFGRALGRVESGKQNTDQAWSQAVQSALAAIK
ncbi:ABC transporter substrate-binding protein [Amycolatopsis pithecellobii]|uniref:Extracellular solute-binding protein n=1 Tax=Amycolatopsis pithecellobii TaxID=664692 RepID=A0A6N7Z5H0_9PSEU|nr:ABC transporter substrate-binding protein [Amycolatopsis pithecellobii]MTD55844.1 extracellular solute-binding protein [Amycolatopsis pithecellobii]